MSTIRRDVGQLFRRDLDQLEAYPAPQPLDDFAATLGVDPADVVKLDQNENPYGYSPLVRERLAHFEWLHVYPDPEHRVLRRRLAEYAGVDEASLVLGNGSDELIELLLRLVVEPGDRVVVPAPTFGFYETAARVAGAAYVTVRRGPEFEVDPTEVAEAVDERAKLVFLASPNNPTGNATPLEVIHRLLDLDALVVVDEAYFEFSGKSAVSILREERPDNLVVLRTFSKWAGLAGLRLGYGVMPARLVAALDRIKPPYSVNQAAEVAGLASLDDLEYLRSTVNRILLERKRLATALAATGLFRPYPSDANFLLCDVVRRSAADVQRHLAERAILVRRYSSPRLENCLRISVGKPEHTDRLIAAVRDLTP
jgi:histidinol-phosphate aminotransferase